MTEHLTPIARYGVASGGEVDDDARARRGRTQERKSWWAGCSWYAVRSARSWWVEISTRSAAAESPPSSSPTTSERSSAMSAGSASSRDLVSARSAEFGEGQRYDVGYHGGPSGSVVPRTVATRSTTPGRRMREAGAPRMRGLARARRPGWAPRSPTATCRSSRFSARDGLQNDPAVLATEQKVELVAAGAAAGLRRQEVASFVNPKRVPRMADAEAVLTGWPRGRTATQRRTSAWCSTHAASSGPSETRVDEVNVVVVRQRHVQPSATRA